MSTKKSRAKKPTLSWCNKHDKPQDCHDLGCGDIMDPVLDPEAVPLALRIVIITTNECGVCGYFKAFAQALMKDVQSGRIPGSALDLPGMIE